MHRRPRIIGYRRNGAPIWEIMGGAPDPDEGQDNTGTDDGGDQGADDDTGQDGDGGDDEGDGDKPKPEDDPNTIEYWKKRSRQNERDAKKYRRERDAATRKSTSSRSGSDSGADGGDNQPSAEEIREQARAEARAEGLRDRVTDKIEAKARQFTDPGDAVAILLRSNEIDDFIDDGKIDVDAITEALKDLAEERPYLLAQSGKRFQGSGDGGARKTTPKRPASIQEAVSKRLNSAS